MGANRKPSAKSRAQLTDEIRRMRQRMERLYCEAGRVTPEVQALSEEIDRMVYRYMRESSVGD